MVPCPAAVDMHTTLLVSSSKSRYAAPTSAPTLSVKHCHQVCDAVQVANAAALAAYLEAHPLVQRVNYAGLPSHPGYVTNARQATSAGSLLSFETGRYAGALRCSLY